MAGFNADLGSLSVKFETNLDRLSRDMAAAGRAVSNTASNMSGSLHQLGNTSAASVQRIGGAVGGLTKQLQLLGIAMSVALTGPIIKFAKDSLNTYKDFGEAINRVRAITNSTGDEYTALREKARDMGRVTVFTASEAADAMGNLAQAGFDANQIMAMIGPTLNQAAAGGVSLERSADIMIGALKVFNLGADQASRVADTFAFVSAKTASNLDDLGDALSYVGTIAPSVGLSLEETVAILGKSGDAMIKGSRAGTSFRQMIASLVEPTPKARKELDKMGVSLKDGTGRMKDFFTLIQEFRSSRLLEGPKKFQESLHSIFEVRAVPFVDFLASLPEGVLEKLSTDSLEAFGESQKQAQIRMEGFFGATRRLNAALQDFQIEIGESLEKSKGLSGFVEGLAQKINFLSKFLDKLDAGTTNTIVNFTLLTAALGPLAIVLGLVGLKVILLAGLFLGVVAAIVIFKDTITDAWDSIGASAEKAQRQMNIQAIEEELRSVKKKIEDFGKTKPTFGPMGGFFFEGESLEELKARQQVIEKSYENMTKLSDKPIKSPSEIFEGAKKDFTSFTEGITKAWDAASLEMDKGVQKQVEGLKRYNENIAKLDKSSKTFTEDVTKLRLELQELFNQKIISPEQFKEAIGHLDRMDPVPIRVRPEIVERTGFQEVFNEAFTEDMHEAMKMSFRGLGRAVMEGGGFEEAFDVLAQTFSNKIADRFSDVIFEETLGKTLDGMFEGTAKTLGDEVQTGIESGSSKASFGSLFATLGSGLSNLVSGIFSGIGSVGSGIGSLFGIGAAGAGMVGGAAPTAAALPAGAMNASVAGPLMFAAGGNPPLGRRAIVGEDGPEMLVPRNALTVIPNHELENQNTLARKPEQTANPVFRSAFEKITAHLKTPLDIAPFARGGNPPLGKKALVGENGPEMLVPRNAMTVIPNHNLGGASGGVNVVMHNDFSGVDAVNRSQLLQFGSALEQRVVQTISKISSQGGSMARRIQGRG